MELFPAIDLRGGKAVRLVQGDYDQMTVYSDQPEQVAEEFRRLGGRNLHLVDLDGAKEGAPANFETIRRIVSSGGFFVEVGGGIRTEQRVTDYLEMGVSRVILGTAAVTDPAFLDRMVAKYGARIAVGVDARDGKVATHGWLETTDLDSFDFCRALCERGVQTVIYTDITRDGKLAGTNLAAYRRLCGIEGLAVVASGGISALEELEQLNAMGAAGAILGKALYTGRLRLDEAVALVQNQAGRREQ